MFLFPNRGEDKAGALQAQWPSKQPFHPWEKTLLPILLLHFLVGRHLRRNGSSPLPHLSGSPSLETCPKSLRHFPLRAGLPFSFVWCWWGGPWGKRWPAVFSCLFERKLAVSQQTQELSIARGRPLPQGKPRGVLASGSHLSWLFWLGEELPSLAS